MTSPRGVLKRLSHENNRINVTVGGDLRFPADFLIATRAIKGFSRHS